MTNYSWLTQLVVGDKVVVLSNRQDTVSTVTRLTATQIIVGEMKFRKDSGQLVGGSTWNSARLEPYTTEKADAIKLNNLALRLALAIHNVQKEDIKRLTLTQCQELFNHLRLLGLVKKKELL